MLVSSVQQNDSVIRIQVTIHFHILFPFRLLQNIEQFPVLHNKFFLVIYFKCISLCMSNPNFQFILPTHLSTLVTISLFSKSVSLCFVKKLICAIVILFSAYVIDDICLSLSDNLQVYLYCCKWHYFSDIPLYVYTTCSLSTHLLMDIYVASMSWLL